MHSTSPKRRAKSINWGAVKRCCRKQNTARSWKAASMAANPASDKDCAKSTPRPSAPMTSRDSMICTCCSIAYAPHSREKHHTVAEDTHIDPVMQVVAALRLAPIPAVQHPVPNVWHFLRGGQPLGTFEALDVVEMRGLLKVDVSQGRLDGHYQLAGFGDECKTVRVRLLHKTPVIASVALARVAAEKTNAALCQHALDQGNSFLESV